MPWWGVATAAAAPILLVAGWTIAARLQPGGFDSVARTISDLEALIGELDRPENKELVARIQGNWGVLEDLYSVDVVYPHRRVLLEHQGQIDQAARNMKALATDALNRAGYGLQPGDDEDEEGGD